MANWALRMILHFTVASHLYGSGGKKRLFWLSNCECSKCGASSFLFNIRSWRCCYCVGCFVTVVDTLTAIWSEGTHTCDRTWLIFFFLYVLFLYKIEINRKSLFILSEKKILIFQVKVFFPPQIEHMALLIFCSNLSIFDQITSGFACRAGVSECAEWNVFVIADT